MKLVKNYSDTFGSGTHAICHYKKGGKAKKMADGGTTAFYGDVVTLDRKRKEMDDLNQKEMDYLKRKEALYLKNRDLPPFILRNGRWHVNEHGGLTTVQPVADRLVDKWNKDIEEAERRRKKTGVFRPVGSAWKDFAAEKDWPPPRDVERLRKEAENARSERKKMDDLNRKEMDYLKREEARYLKKRAGMRYPWAWTGEFKSGGAVKANKSCGFCVSADGIAKKGKTRGRFV